MSIIRYIFIFLIGATFFSACTQKEMITKEKGLSFAERFEQLPYFKTGTQTYQYSSTDPAEDQFNDYFHWLRTEADSSAVLADITGPGCIYRIWSTGNVGDTNRIKIYLDGSLTPNIDTTFNSFHNYPPLRDKPQVGSGAGDNYLAWWSYMPIPFKKSCRIVRDGNFRPFYNITYHTYSDTIGVTTWTGKEDYKTMEKMWRTPETDPKSQEGNIVEKVSATLSPNQTFDVLNYNGSGHIASIKISNYTPSPKLRLKIYWDNDSSPAVDAPVKWFFGSVDNGGDVKALGVGTVGNNGYCYYPMPFWKNAKIELVNLSDSVTSPMTIEVQYSKKEYDEKNAAYFHATANEIDKPGKSYQCLKTSGRGHVVGIAKRMPKGGHACEADEIYFIDGRKFPDIYGTGEEDYANCAWWRNKYNTYPTHGHVGNDCYYRIHYPDVLVFEDGIDMEFESWQNYYIASVVWYYQKPEASLVSSDTIDIGNELSEQLHQFTADGEKWSGSKVGIYPGRRIYIDSLMENGRSVAKSSSFTVKLDPANNGARLRLRTEHTNFQRAVVYVDGELVKERDWYVSKNNYDALWIDSDFELPASYTRGKKSITVKLDCVPDAPEWTAYRYTVYSYR